MTIRRHLFRPFAVLLLPLALGACGMPIGVTIASFVADAFSLATTDKTITDHGISAVTGEDCALWRGLKGEGICNPPAGKPTAVADAKSTGSAEAAPVATAPAEAASPAPGSDTPEAVPVVAEAPVAAESLPALGDSPPAKAEAAEPAMPAAPTQVAEAAPAPPTPAVVTAAKAPSPSVPAARAPEPPPASAGSGVSEAAAQAPGGTYLVIASYARAADAERFARHQSGLDWRVLSGTAHGKRVFRVALGPIAGERASAEKGRLEKAGFPDVWALRQDHPDVVAESESPDQVAELD